MSITPLDSIRRAIARHNGVADPTVLGGAHGQGGRIENGLFPASTLSKSSRASKS